MQHIPTSNRRQFLGGAIGAASLAALPTWAKPIGANEDVRVAVIGFNSRGQGHISSLLGIKGVRIVALCDADKKVLERTAASLKKKNNLEVKQYEDFRQCCADPDIDAITIATPNHSHVLIAMTGLANGKHVYVEKPVCHNPIEGRKLVEAGAIANAKGLILQHGMQRRSSPGWAEAMEFVKGGQIGKLTLSRGLNYKARQSIGKIAAPISPDANGRIVGEFRNTDGSKTQACDVNWNLWSAPRAPQPLHREQLHYDWHWQWANGNGDIGNQGPHQLDVARWGLGNPELLPARVMSFGNRWGYDDDGQTANNQMAFYDYPNAPLLFDNRGLPSKDMNWKKGYEPVYVIGGKVAAPRIGNVLHCEGGLVAEKYAYDLNGQRIKEFANFNDGTDHMKNYIDSIRAGKRVNDNLHIAHGYHAACLAHLANYSYRVGKKVSAGEIKERLANDKAGLETFEHFVANLEANKIDVAAAGFIAGPWLSFDPKSERFTGEFAAEANKLMEEEYAAGFELPAVS